MPVKKTISDLIKKSLTPPPKLSLSQFAEERFRLSSENSAEAGKYYINRAEYQRDLLDAVTDPKYQEIVYCLSSQTGKTTVTLITLLYFMGVEPAPILLVTPSEAMAKSISKDRLNPALRDCVGFSDILKENKSKESTNNILSKSFTGGSLNIIGSGSASQLASRPIRVLLLDEVDRFDADAGGEGHAASLAARRTANFYNRKIIYNATPTDAETSYIWAKFQESNQNYYHLKCPHCEDYFVPVWDLVRWEKDSNGDHMPHTALLHCEKCGVGLNDAERNQAVRNGKWVAQYPERSIAGFHLSALHSPWAEVPKLATEWISAQNDPSKLKVFVNTVLGKAWEQSAQKLDDINLIARATDISIGNIPDDVSVLTLGCDTQIDRFEAVLVGHGSEGRKYILGHKVINGDPATALPQQLLRDYILTKYTRNDGAELKVMATVVDSGGSATQAIYRFAANNLKYRVYAGKGREGNLPIFPQKASVTDKGRLYIIGVDSAKDAIYSALKIDDPESPGYIHLSDTLSPNFCDQLVSEKKILKNKNGYHRWQWVLPSGKHNEALDCVGYALAAYESLGVDATYFAKKLNKSKAMAVSKPDSTDPIVLPDPILPKPIPTNPILPKQIPPKPPQRRPKFSCAGGSGWV